VGSTRALINGQNIMEVPIIGVLSIEVLSMEMPSMEVPSMEMPSMEVPQGMEILINRIQVYMVIFSKAHDILNKEVPLKRVLIFSNHQALSHGMMTRTEIHPILRIGHLCPLRVVICPTTSMLDLGNLRKTHHLRPHLLPCLRICTKDKTNITSILKTQELDQDITYCHHP